MADQNFFNVSDLIQTATRAAMNESLQLYSRNGGADATMAADAPPSRTDSVVIRTCVLALLAALSTIGNVWTIWNIRKSRVAKKLTRQNCTAIYLLITHLSVSDLLVTGFCMVGEAVWSFTVEWLGGDLLCKLYKFAQMFSLYLSTYVLVLIGLDRMWAVKYPMRTVNMGQHWKVLLGLVYLLSALFSVPQVFIFHVQFGPFADEFLQCVTHGFYTQTWQEQLYATLSLILMFIIPLTILIGSYLATFRTISHNERRFQPDGDAMSRLTTSTHPNNNNNNTGSTNNKNLANATNFGWILHNNYSNRQRLLQRAKRKSLKLSIMIILAFIICWCPYYIMMIIFIFLDPNKETEDDLQSAIFFFGMSNSLVNPLIYGLFHLLPRRRKFFNSFQCSQTTRTGIAEVSHQLMRTNSNLISQMGKPPAKR